MAERTFNGVEILRSKTLRLKNPDVTFKGDVRFDTATEYAAVIGDAIKANDANLLPPQVDKAIITAKGEVQEKMLSEAFQIKIHELYGKYDDKVGLAFEKASDKLASLAREILGKKADEKLTAEDEKKLLEQLTDGKLSDEDTREMQEIIVEQAKSIQLASFPEENGAEITRLLGKDSENPDRGLICRHLAPLKAAMWAAAGFEGAKVVPVDGHVTVITPLGNVDEGTVDDPKNAYLVTALGGLDSLVKNEGGMLIAFNSSGKISSFTNIRGGQTTSQYEQQISDVERLNSFLKNHGAAEFYQDSIDTLGPVDPQTIRNSESSKPRGK